jgi:hypothetical protein
MSRTTLMFKVYRGATLVQTRRFDAEVVKLGSLPSCDLRLDDAGVARQHAVVEVVGQEVKLIDLGSAAGTSLNGTRISKFATLKDGDVMTLGNTRIEAQISNTKPAVAPVAVTPAQPQIDAREYEVQNGSRVAQVTAMFNDTVIDVQHLGQTRDRRKSAPAWLALGGGVALAGAALFGMEAAQDWDGYSERAIAAHEAGKPAPAKPGNGLGGLGFGLAMLGLVPIGVGFTRMQDRARKSYTLGEGHDAAMHVPAATLPNGELFPLVHGDGDYALQFTADMMGELTVDGTSVTLAALISSGRATQVGAAYSIPLAPGAQARVRHGALTFFIHSVAPGVVTARKSEMDKPFWVTNGGAFAVLGGLLMMTHLMPNDAGALSVQEDMESNRFVGYLAQPNQTPEEEEVVQDTQKQEPGGVAGARHAGADGKMGDPSSKKPAGRYAMKGPASAIPSLARDFDPEQKARTAGILGLMKADSGHFLASPYGSYAQGNDDADIWGQVVGSEVGSAFGNGGMGLIGTGRGGGGNGEGTVGLGSVGMIGHNKPGDGSGMLRTTGFGPRVKRVPEPRLGVAQVQGGLDKDLIRRVVRAHINEIRYCYNQGLARDPNLKGRVAVQFQIGATGKVPTAVVSESDVKDSNVGSCIASAVRRWQFPKPAGGGNVIVTYPFVLAAD